MKLPALLALILLAGPVFAQDKPSSILAAAGGRYVFGQISSMRADQYLLDTQTGRVWQLVTDKDGKLNLQPVPYISMVGQLHLEPPTALREGAEIDAKLKEMRSATNAPAKPFNVEEAFKAPLRKPIDFTKP